MRAHVLTIVSVLLCPVLIAQQTPAPAATAASPTEKPRVFITDSQSWEMEGAGGGANGVYGAETHGGARPQTAEIVKTFGQRCPAVIVNNKQSIADYVVVLDHEGGKGLLRHKDKVAVFERVSGDVVISHSTLSVGGSVEDACKGIMQHWATHSAELIAAKEKRSAQAAEIATPAARSAASAQAAIAISSTPSGADIETDGAFVGNTPSTIDLAPGIHEITVKKAGFADWTRKLNVTGGSVNLDATLEAAPASPAPAAAPGPAAGSSPAAGH